MDLTIFTMLAQDGVVNGAIYVLLAVVLVLVYAVTRIVFLPQGEFVEIPGNHMSAVTRPELGDAIVEFLTR